MTSTIILRAIYLALFLFLAYEVASEHAPDCTTDMECVAIYGGDVL